MHQLDPFNQHYHRVLQQLLYLDVQSLTADKVQIIHWTRRSSAQQRAAGLHHCFTPYTATFHCIAQQESNNHLLEF